MKVEIYSDVACPWCYIGERRFTRALAAFPGAGELEIVFRPYQLDPRAPTRAERATACSSAARIEDLVRIVTIALPRGGSVSPDAAGKIMSALPGYTEFTSSIKRTSCR